MNGSIKISFINKASNEYYSYYTLNQMSPYKRKQILKRLRTLYKQGHIKIRCTCSPQNPKMTVAYYEPTDTYYLRSSKYEKSEHDEKCYFFCNQGISSDTETQSGWKIDEKGNFHITLDSHDFKLVERKSEGHHFTKTQKSHNHNHRSGISTTKGSINHLIKLLVTKSWNLCINKDAKENNIYPTMKDVFEKIYSYTTSVFYIRSRLSLKKILFHRGKIGRLYYIEKEYHSIAQPFVIFKWIRAERKSDSQHLVYVKNPVSDEIYEFLAPSGLMEFAMRNTHGLEPPYIIGGFVKYNGPNQFPEFISMSILPVNDYGVPVESSYERFFYNKICGEERLIERPIESRYYPKFDGLMPDGLLRDTDPYTIIEIFGMSKSNQDYHYHKDFKINFYKKLSNDYQFWHWDAYKNPNIPSLPLANRDRRK